MIAGLLCSVVFSFLFLVWEKINIPTKCEATEDFDKRSSRNHLTNEQSYLKPYIHINLIFVGDDCCYFTDLPFLIAFNTKKIIYLLFR
jgi:hypothetical protein